eukprot:TRINITY_DN5046_c0_g1_i3.p1 TRINITY_DN5046_c0_g1~~TRINITY_DN5046_c0_g1_i3.p1  ORF type:complete len:281 (+),score=28.11 TRINITY_DN5046_c0_g1_i3:67-909(+)
MDPAQVLQQIGDSQPQFRDKHDALAFALHSAFLKAGFKLVGLDEDGADADLAAAPAGWNQTEDTYCFRYTHPRQANQQFLLKMLRLENNLIVYGVKKNTNELHTVEFNVDDYVGDVNAAVPQMYRELATVLRLFENGIVNNLVPPAPREQPREQPRRYDPYDPYRNDPLRDDPLRIPSRRPQPVPYGPRGDFDQDLYGPLGPMPLGPGFGAPPGSLMGPGHPAFGGPGRGVHPAFGGPGPAPLPGQGRGRGIRFDPYNPLGRADPDNDHLPPPGPSNWYG